MSGEALIQYLYRPVHPDFLNNSASTIMGGKCILLRDAFGPVMFCMLWGVKPLKDEYCCSVSIQI